MCATTIHPETTICLQLSGQENSGDPDHTSSYLVATTARVSGPKVGAMLVDRLRASLPRLRQHIGTKPASAAPPDLRRHVLEAIGELQDSTFAVDAMYFDKHKKPWGWTLDSKFFEEVCSADFKYVLSIPSAQAKLHLLAWPGTTQREKAFHRALDEWRRLHHRPVHWDFVSYDGDPTMWLTNYCAWAVQRSLEGGDDDPLQWLGGRYTGGLPFFHD
jgi:hypothetical protein